MTILIQNLMSRHNYMKASVLMAIAVLLGSTTFAQAEVSTTDNPFNLPADSSITTPATATPQPEPLAARKHSRRSHSTSKSASSNSGGGSCGNLPRTCGQMTSCAQAQKALQCGNTRLDRDKDGVPCESICG